MLNGSSDCRIVTNWKLTAWKALLYDNNQAIEEKDSKEQPIEKTFPNQYNVSLPLFNEIVADQLAHDRSGIYYRIRLTEDQSPTSQPLQFMSRVQWIILKEWLEENMPKGLSVSCCLFL